MQTVIIDSHNEVLLYWIREYCRHKMPLVVVRIDRHHDMFSDCPRLPAKEGRNIFDYFDRMMPEIYEYAKRRLNEGNFTCPAFHYGILGSLYHFDPRKEKIDAYGRVFGGEFLDAPKTRIRSSFAGGKKIDLIEWDGASTRLRKQNGKLVPAPQSIGVRAFEVDLEESSFPVVIGFDLDGLCTTDERELAKRAIEKRLKRVKSLLECISSPVLACIARSQTPRAYVPADMVDELQEAALCLMKRKCQAHYALPIATTGSIREAFQAG
jgi:hypothetical protein